MFSRCFRTVASLDYQDPRDLDVRKTVGHPEHHLALAAGQSIGRVRVERRRCRAKPTSELGGAVQPDQVRVEPMQDQAFAIFEITVSGDVESCEPSPRGIQVDLNLVGNPLLKVGIEIDGGPLAPAEEVREHDQGLRIVAEPVPVERHRSGTFPPVVVVVLCVPSVCRAQDGAVHHAAPVVDFGEGRVRAADDLGEQVEQLRCEWRRSLDRLRLLEERENRLEISWAKPCHQTRSFASAAVLLRTPSFS